MPTRELTAFPRTLLRPAILVLLQEQDDHGYALMDRLVDLGLGRPDSAGVYRALRALEEEGAVRSWWAAAERGAPRRVYALSGPGRHQLDRSLEGMDRQRDVLESLVGRARVGAATRSSTRTPEPPRQEGARLLQLA